MSLIFMTLFIINNLTLRGIGRRTVTEFKLCMVHSLYKILNDFVLHSLINAKI